MDHFIHNKHSIESVWSASTSIHDLNSNFTGDFCAQTTYCGLVSITRLSCCVVVILYYVVTAQKTAYISKDSYLNFFTYWNPFSFLFDLSSFAFTSLIEMIYRGIRGDCFNINLTIVLKFQGLTF